MYPIRKMLSLTTLALLMIGSGARGAEPSSQVTIDLSDPVQMVQQTTDAVLQLASDARQYAEQDPQRYYKQVEALVDQVVDVDYFARGVMGTYASARRYRALESDEERARFRERVERFAKKLKQSFIETYADTLLSFNGGQVALEKPRGGASDDDSERTLTQKIEGSSGDIYRVQYRLHKNREGDWLIYNVIAEGLNMGQIYRNQFAEAVESNGGDIDYVVSNWHKLMTPAEETAEAKGSGQRQ